MATLHLRGVPGDLYKTLERLARERDSSLRVETIRLLRRALAFERPGQAHLIEAIRTSREPVRRGSQSATGLIRENRDRS